MICSSVHFDFRIQSSRGRGRVVKTVNYSADSFLGRTARAVHDLSERRDAPFVRCDLTTVRGDLALSRLFGHMPGSFTGAIREHIGDFPAAHRGTLLLEEIGKADLGVQGQLLEAVEHGWVQPLGCERWFTVDVRVVAVTNRSLEELVTKSEFLPDLYARLLAGVIEMPPLRERVADIPGLIDQYVRQTAHDLRLATRPRVSDELLHACMKHDWPSNLRELANTIERAVLEADGASILRLCHVAPHLPLGRGRRSRSRTPASEILRRYHLCGGDAEATAESLSIHRATVYRHVKREQQSKRAVASSDANTVRPQCDQLDPAEERRL